MFFVKNETMPINHFLQPGQIRFLYIWVHPTVCRNLLAEEMVEMEIEDYISFIERLRAAPHTAVIRTPYEEAKKNLSSLLAQRIEEVDAIAAQQLNGRYHVWPRGYVDGADENDIQRLAEVLNLVPQSNASLLRDWEQSYFPEPHFLARTFIFGKIRDTCPLYQAYECSLHNVSSTLLYLSTETPTGIEPATIKNPLPYHCAQTNVIKC